MLNKKLGVQAGMPLINVLFGQGWSGVKQHSLIFSVISNTNHILSDKVLPFYQDINITQGWYWNLSLREISLISWLFQINCILLFVHFCHYINPLLFYYQLNILKQKSNIFIYISHFWNFCCNKEYWFVTYAVFVLMCLCAYV